MTFGDLVLSGWLVGIAIAFFYKVLARNRKNAEGNLWLLTIAIFVPLIFASFLWLVRREHLEESRSAPGVSSEKLYETHVSQGKPTIAIYISGFLDSSFNAYIEGSPRKVIFQSLPASNHLFKDTTNSLIRKSAAQRIVANPDMSGMYEVFWSSNSTRLALAFKGYFIEAYDLDTKQKIETKQTDEIDYQYIAFDALIEGFLNGKSVKEAEIVAIRKSAYLQAVKAYEAKKKK